MMYLLPDFDLWIKGFPTRPWYVILCLLLRGYLHGKVCHLRFFRICFNQLLRFADLGAPIFPHFLPERFDFFFLPRFFFAMGISPNRKIIHVKT